MSEPKQRQNPQNRMFSMGIIAFLALIVIILFSSATFLTIDAGNRGVLFRRFAGGLEKDKTYSPGFHVLAKPFYT